MSSFFGVWKLRSFIVDGKVEPFGPNPVGLLVFEKKQYMGAQLTSKTGSPVISFSANFEVIDNRNYRFTPISTNNPEKFPIGVTTAPKEYRVDDKTFTESWVDDGKSKVVAWTKLC